MSINSVDSLSNVPFKGNEIKKEENNVKTPEQIKDGKKKLALAAAATATIAIAGIAIARGKHKEATKQGAKVAEKIADVVQEAAEQGSKAVQKGADTAGEVAKKVEQKATDVIQEAVEQGSKAAQKNADTVGEIAEKVTPKTAEVIQEATEQGVKAVQKNADTVGEIAEKVTPKTAEVIQEATEQGSKTVQKVADAAGEAAEKVVPKATDKAQKASEKLIKAQEAYQKRLANIKDGKIDFNQRLKEANGIAWGNQDGLKVNSKRMKQLNKILSPEQQAALDDMFIDTTLRNYTTRGAYVEENLKFIADNFTADELVKMQQQTYTPRILEDFISGTYNTPEDYNELATWLQKAAKK